MTNVENPGKSPEKKTSYPLSFKLRRAVCIAVLGAGFLTSCGVVDNRAKANIEAAGISPMVANDPDLIWAAANGATADELRDYADNLLRQREMEMYQARETQMAIDADNLAENTLAVPEEVVEQSVALEKISEGVFSFVTNENIEITSKTFIRRMKDSLKEKTNTEPGQVFIAVPDDDSGVTRIFMDSTVESYKNTNGIFYAYPGDTLYVATDMQALTQLLNSQGINYETFGLP